VFHEDFRAGLQGAAAAWRDGDDQREQRVSAAVMVREAARIASTTPLRPAEPPPAPAAAA
jgi:hypothetical protein